MENLQLPKRADFPRTVDGLTEYRSTYARVWRALHVDAVRAYNETRGNSFTETRRNFINAAKDKPCEDCGQKYPPYVMDFDHVRDRKRFNISAAKTKGVSLPQLRLELEKCDVVCSNCHRERTHQRHQHKLKLILAGSGSGWRRENWR